MNETTAHVKSIHKDRARFREIVRGKVKADLKKYISRGELIGKKGDQVVSIPVPQIELPRFTLAHGQGVGQGGQEGAGQAGDRPGEHVLEVEMSIEELADILGEELGLPRIRPKGEDRIETRKVKFTGIYRVGPQALRHFRRTFKQALKRTIASGLYDPNDPLVVPVREDFRYRSWKDKPTPKAKAVAIYMMDVSGSMGDEQKELVRLVSFWIDTWLRAHYKGIVVRYITHDAEAREVDEETFFHTRESGGTMISSAYRLCAELIRQDYAGSEWNIYPFHFSDGDNWSADDTAEAIGLLKHDILPRANQFAYGQVHSHYGSGQFYKDLVDAIEDEKLVCAEIKDREGVVEAIKRFLKAGK